MPSLERDLRFACGVSRSVLVAFRLVGVRLQQMFAVAFVDVVVVAVVVSGDAGSRKTRGNTRDNQPVKNYQPFEKTKPLLERHGW